MVPHLYAAVITIGLIPTQNERVGTLTKKRLWDNFGIPGWMGDVITYIGYQPLAVVLGALNEKNSYGPLDADTIAGLVPQTPEKLKIITKCLGLLDFPPIHVEDLRLECPLHVIHGSLDTMGAAEVIVEQLDAVQAPSKRIYWVEGAGHPLHLTHTAEAKQILRSIRGTIAE